MGRAQTPQIKLQSDLESVSTALEISEDLLQFLQVKGSQANADDANSNTKI